jgi:pyroglutamyl-peptidase
MRRPSMHDAPRYKSRRQPAIGAARPRLLVTGFGPFPGAPENPTERLIKALAGEAAEAFGASAFHAAVLRTEYRWSWAELERLTADLAPDIVVHFGLSEGIEAIHLECVGRNVVNPAKPDACGHAPSSSHLAEDGPDTLASTFPAEAILSALHGAGIPAALSDDAGDYVCNATLYRSLHAAPPTRRVGFVHVPPEGRGGFTRERLADAARILLRAALA